MNENVVPVRPLDYDTTDQAAGWRPIVRACAYLAMAHAAALLLDRVSTYVMFFELRNTPAALQRWDARAMAGVAAELLVSVACIGVLVAATACAKFSRRADRWMLIASVCLVSALVVQAAYNGWATLSYVPAKLSVGVMVGYIVQPAAELAMALLVPLLLIWLLHRPEARRLFGA